MHFSVDKDEVSFVRRIQARGSFGGYRLCRGEHSLWGALDSDSVSFFQLINKFFGFSLVCDS